jgi:hypothetical protein
LDNTPKNLYAERRAKRAVSINDQPKLKYNEESIQNELKQSLENFTEP